MERFYDPDQGAVLLDGLDIRQIRLGWYRNQARARIRPHSTCRQRSLRCNYAGIHSNAKGSLNAAAIP